MAAVRLGLPDVGQLSWSDVFRLRRSRYWADFRDRMATVPDDDVSSASLLLDEMWEFIRRTQPSLTRTIATGVLGNLPVGPVNPLGVMQVITEAEKAAALRQDFGWIYFLLHARQM